MLFKFAVAIFIIISLAVAIVDYLSKSIYDWMLLLGSALVYPLLIFSGYSIFGILVGAIVGFLGYGLIYGAAYLYYKEEAFGFGDVLFNTYICGFLGAFGIFYTIIHSFLTFFVAFAIIILVSIIKFKLSRKTEIPLAPAMAISSVITFFYFEKIMHLILNFYS